MDEKLEMLGVLPPAREIAATEASNHFGALLDEVSQGRAHFIITRSGRAKAVMLGIDQYQEILEILETAAELNDPEYMEGIREAREDIRLGRTMTLEELERLISEKLPQP